MVRDVGESLLMYANPKRSLCALLLGLTALGCVAAPGSAGALGREIRGVSMVDTAVEHQAWSAVADGRVELLTPTIVDEAAESSDDSVRPSFAPLVHEVEIADWIVDEDAIALEFELRNACGLDLDYAFGPSEDPGAVEQGHRNLAGHTAQAQAIESGDWLRLWHEGRWLATVTTLADGAVMEVAGTCDAVVVEFEDDAGVARELAIHWELDADTTIAGSTLMDADAPELALEPDLEVWGTDVGATVEIQLFNHCGQAVDYAFSPSLDDDVDRSSTLPGHSAREVEVPADWWLRYRVLDDAWRGGSMTSASGARMWIAANCVDFGLGHGDVLDAS